MRTHKLLLVASLIIISLSLGACATPTPTPTQTAPTQAAPTATPLPPQPTATEEPAPTATPEPSPTQDTSGSMTAVILEDGLGREIRLSHPAQRIVSLAPSNTEFLFAIGAGQQVVARDSFSDYPTEALDVTDIGGGWGEIDTETILSLDPDLVLAAEINAVEQIEELENLGLAVFYLANPDDLEGMLGNLYIVAQLTGREVEAQDLMEDLGARMAAVDEIVVSAENRPVVFYELDGTDPNAPWTSGPGTFIDLLVARAGGQNLGNVLKDAWAQISVEELITQNPEIILLGDYIWGGVQPEDVAARAGWEVIAAVQNNQVYPFDDNLVSRPGPRMVAGLEQLAKILHPELFQ